MSVFGLIKKGRQAAKEHKAGVVEKQKAEEQKPAYRHVPTHAAVDALSGAPSSWRNEDRPRILEQHRRRSAMAASGLGPAMGTPLGMNPVHVGMPRVNSTLSNVSYPSLHANPMVALPRTYSYHGGIHPPWAERSAEVVYSQVDQHPAAGPLPTAMGKGKGIDRSVSVGFAGRSSRTSSKAPSPVGSSGDSTSSQDDLEMKSVHHHRATGSSASQTSEDSRTTGHAAHRLHPSQSRSRKVSDPPPAAMDRFYIPRPGFRPAMSRTGSAPSVTMGNVVPPVPSLPPMSFGPSLASSTAPSSSRPPSVRNHATAAAGAPASGPGYVSPNRAPSTPVTRSESRPESQSSSASPVSIVSPASPTTSASGSPITPAERQFEFNFPQSATKSTSPTSRMPAAAPQVSSPGKKTPQMAKALNRFPDFDPTNYRTEQLAPAGKSSPPLSSRHMPRASSMGARDLPVEFDESALSSIQESAVAPPSEETVASQKLGKGKLTKTPHAAKPAKKNRWSLKSRPTPVAG